MIDTLNAVYSRRHNRDGSFDSICRTCFATAAHAKDEAGLAKQERNHCCEPEVLAYWEFNRLMVKVQPECEVLAYRGFNPLRMKAHSDLAAWAYDAA
jgi:hypothetical protein